MLWLHRSSGAIEHRGFRDLPSILQPGDLLVMNDTRVTAMRLFGRKRTGGAVEALLLREGQVPRSFEALTKPAKRLRPGTELEFEGDLRARVESDLGEGLRVIVFEDVPGWRERLAEVGQTPLPPYIHERLPNAERYQTTYARSPGSAAAPTAGLHFTSDVFEALERRGVKTATVTLDVGIDTFRPLSTEKIEEHSMHGERCSVPEATASAVADCRGRVIAVGTTSVRTLESLAVAPRVLRAGSLTTSIFISPGYEYKICDGMLTNFHMPRTTMLVMLAAMTGLGPLKAAYESAVANRYRFLSFGDSMLILDPYQ